MASMGPFVVGVDVGGTNTDSVLLDLSLEGADAVVASQKVATTSNVTRSVETTLTALLDSSNADRQRIAALAIGTTHFLNAIIERDVSRVEKVAVLRLAAHGFSEGVPPFADWPPGLKRIVHGYSAIVPGGVNLDGKLLAPVDEEAIRREAAVIKSKGLKNVVVAGIGSPQDDRFHQEEQVCDILRKTLGAEANVVRSHTVAGSGLLARENASILNAAILSFAKRTIRSFVAAMRRVGLRCPLYLTSNAGHLMPSAEALEYPIRIFSSGPTNSIRGAALLAGSWVSQSGCIVVDIGGTTADIGYVLKNGYPRLSKTYAELAGVKVNLDMPSVESVGLGGGSILHVDPEDGTVRVGPDSVGHDLLKKALCFGGDTATATDVAVALGAEIGSTSSVTLPQATLEGARAKMTRILENAIDRVKLSPEPCKVILVGGGAILCPEELRGVSELRRPTHAGVANAIGAAMAKIYGEAELMVDVSKVEEELARVRDRAVANAVAKGGSPDGVIVLNEEVTWVPYADGQRMVKVEVACAADHGKLHSQAFRSLQDDLLGDEAEIDETFEETKVHEVGLEAGLDERDAVEAADLNSYRPNVTADGVWSLSEVDIKFLEIGCYILGCGGGGSPYTLYLRLRQLLRDGETITIVRSEDLKDNDILTPIAGIGTPAVGLERPGGPSVLHAVQAMSTELKVNFTQMLAVEIGGSNGLQPLTLGCSRNLDVPTVDADLMGRAFPNFEMISQYVAADSVNDLLPVVICSGTGQTVVIPAGQPDSASAGERIRSVCASMGFAAGAAGNPLSGAKLRAVGIPNTFSLAWRLGRVVCRARRAAALGTVPEALIKEVGGPGSARRVFQGKICAVRSRVTATAHSIGEVVIKGLDEDEMESDADRSGQWREVVVPFINENLAVLAKDAGGEETVLATAPDLIILLDLSTGSAIGTQEYRYGLKVTVMLMAPHPIWTSKRGLEIVGPRAFGLPYEYTSSLKYTAPRSVIEEFRGVDTVV